MDDGDSLPARRVLPATEKGQVIDLTRYFPDPILCRPMPLADPTAPELKGYLELMQTMMKDRRGIGVAANQVGIPLRVCIIAEPGMKLVTMINPEITERGPVLMSEEGCLSCPGVTAHVPRSTWVQAKWLDENGLPQAERFEGQGARIVQHEVDHLEGLCIVHKMTPVDKTNNKKALKILDQVRSMNRYTGSKKR